MHGDNTVKYLHCFVLLEMFLEAESNDFYYKFGNTVLYPDIEMFYLILNSESLNVSYVNSCLSVCPRTKSTLTLSHKQSPDVNINFYM
jgi:hypothetical protein